jgi:malonyl-CoA/methylmalonyl-CoA synthetase
VAIRLDSFDGADAGAAPVRFRDLQDRALRMAHALRERGVQTGDVVALKLDKSLAFLEIHLGALAIGAATLPLHPASTDREVADRVADAGAALCIDDLEAAAAMRGSPPLALADLPDLAGDALAVLCYTSGTTGRPKGARITHDNLLATVRALHEAWRWSSADAIVHALPLFHIHGLFVAQHGALYAGAAAHWIGSFDAERILDALCDATLYMGVPTHYARFLSTGPGDRDLSRVRLFTSGSAPLPAADHAAFEEAFGHRILERYGMTEVGIVLSNPYEGERRPGAVGFPLPGVRARITDDADQPVGTGTIGEIRIAGPSVCAGYHDRPEATEAALGDGWMHTGDLGFVDDDGYFHVVGRKSDMILSGGMNVYPREVEAVVAAHPGVAEVAVFGLPDPDLGERVSAAIVPTQTARAHGGPALSELEAAVRAACTAYKLPRRWFVLDALPRNAMGKVQKALLRRRYAVTVRPADAADIDRIVAWNQALCAETEDFTLDEPTLRAGVERVFSGTAGARYLVAERDGEAAGQLMLTTEWSDWRNAEVWWIQSVYIAPAHRRCGVYRALHGRAMRDARRAGAAGLRLYVETTNTRAMHTYEAMGMTAEHYRMYEQMFGGEG